MQTIHKVCLILTGVCVTIICVGLGLGIAAGVTPLSDSNDTTVEYEAYDKDYVDYGSSSANASGVNLDYVDYGSSSVNASGDNFVASVRFGGVIQTKPQEKGIRD